MCMLLFWCLMNISMRFFQLPNPVIRNVAINVEILDSLAPNVRHVKTDKKKKKFSCRTIFKPVIDFWKWNYWLIWPDLSKVYTCFCSLNWISLWTRAVCGGLANPGSRINHWGLSHIFLSCPLLWLTLCKSLLFWEWILYKYADLIPETLKCVSIWKTKVSYKFPRNAHITEYGHGL